MTTLDDLLAKKDSLASAHEVMRHIVESVQAELVKSVQVQRERDSIQSKVEELEQMLSTQRAIVQDIHQHRRIEAACAAMQGIIGNGSDSSQWEVASDSVKYADALLAELAKPVGEVAK